MGYVVLPHAEDANVYARITRTFVCLYMCICIHITYMQVLCMPCKDKVV